MGVYISGMEMPKEGTVIAIYKLDGKFYASVHGTELCPLVPVPPCGGLIEKGTILDKCYQHFEDYMNGIVDGKTALLNIEKEIKAAPTIIPAEEGE